MKNVLILLMLISFSMATLAQSIDTVKKEVPGADQSVTSSGKKDTTKIKLGNKGIAIVEDGSGTSVKITDLDEGIKEKNKEEEETSAGDDNGQETRRKNKFKGHWSGIDLGLNNFMDRNGSMTRSGQTEYMDLNTGRSWDINLNIMQYGFGFGTNSLGLVTGLGFEFNNYFFDGNNNIHKDSLGNIASFKGSTPGNYAPQGVNLDVSKFATVFLTVPLLLELQLPHSAPASKRFHVSAGVIGGLKLGSHSKSIFYLDNKKQKIKVRDDFNINALRYGFTARIGYHGLNLFANYYPTPFFETGKGPELYPVAVGLTIGL